jgi:hypothetical protein
MRWRPGLPDVHDLLTACNGSESRSIHYEWTDDLNYRTFYFTGAETDPANWYSCGTSDGSPLLTFYEAFSRGGCSVFRDEELTTGLLSLTYSLNTAGLMIALMPGSTMPGF